MVFYWRKANNGRKALAAELGQSSKFLFRFPRQERKKTKKKKQQNSGTDRDSVLKNNCST